MLKHCSFFLRAFDVELIYIAEYLNIPTGEVAVRWTEIEGSFCFSNYLLGI